MLILGISCFYHDSSACILRDGQILSALAEERFTRIKHDNSFPLNAIFYCLDYLGIASNEIDAIVFYEKPIIKFERIVSQHLDSFPKSVATFVKNMSPWFEMRLNIKKLLGQKLRYHGRIFYVPHHLSHAASSYYLSDFSKAAIVTLDGVGEWATTTVGRGEGKSIHIDKEIQFPHSLGLLYSTLTAYLGFKVNNDEYKVMGLAAYGNPKKFKPQMDKIIDIFSDGSFALNTKYFDFIWSNHMPSQALCKLFGHPIRKPENGIYSYHEDIAASLQVKLEEVVFNLLNAVYRKYKTRNLCLAGGVALNSVMNGKIVKNTPFRNIFIPPDPGDGGGSMGASLYVHFKYSSRNLRKEFRPYLGPSFAWYQVESVLKNYNLKYTTFKNTDSLLDKVVSYLDKDKVIGWFQGRMEWGPRALGARSILASAGDEKMREILNRKVKKRETFRPFAPVILKKYVERYFRTNKQPLNLGKFMLIVLPFKERGKIDAPATVHVDGSGRLQIIEKDDNPLYYKLVRNYMRRTKKPILINTSFNIRGEPIVCSPEDAVKCFLKTDIDVLVLDNYLVKKSSN